MRFQWRLSLVLMRVFVPCRLPLGPILILRIPGWLLFRSLANAYLLAPFADRSASYPRPTFSATSSFATSFSLAIYCHFCDPHRHHSLLQYSLLSFLARAAIFLSGRFFLKSGEKWHLLVRLFDSASSARLQTPLPPSIWSQSSRLPRRSCWTHVHSEMEHPV